MENVINSRIRISTSSDIAVIHKWLIEQESLDIDTFLCNWNLTLKMHSEEKLLVFIDPISQQPIAYHWGDFRNSGILEIRADKRKQGIGRQLVEHSIAKAMNEDTNILHVQCRPSTSVRFWEKMGFHIYDEENGYACKRLRKILALPEGGTNSSIQISFYAEDAKWDESILPLEIYKPKAIFLNGEFFLQERIVFFNSYGAIHDPIVKIVIDGREIYFDKVKYDDAKLIGVQSDGYTFFIDKLRESAEKSKSD